MIVKSQIEKNLHLIGDTLTSHHSAKMSSEIKEKIASDFAAKLEANMLSDISKGQTKVDNIKSTIAKHKIDVDTYLYGLQKQRATVDEKIKQIFDDGN